MLATFFATLDAVIPLDPSVKASIGQLTQPLHVPRHTLLLQEGQVCRSLYFIGQGLVRAYRQQADGREITTWFAAEQELFTSGYSFISRAPSRETIEVLEDVTGFCISQQALTDLYEQHPVVDRLGRRLTEHYYFQLEELFASQITLSATERYERLISTAPGLLQRVSLGHIASYLGMTQETLSRIRARPIRPSGPTRSS